MSRKHKHKETAQVLLGQLWAKALKNRGHPIPSGKGLEHIRCEVHMEKLAQRFLDNSETSKKQRGAIVHIATCHVRDMGLELLLTHKKELYRLLGQVYVKAKENK